MLRFAVALLVALPFILPECNSLYALVRAYQYKAYYVVQCSMYVNVIYRTDAIPKHCLVLQLPREGTQGEQ